ncbi:uncharacterized protein SPAPADRAFT_61222 [Spathaspora passalidarum NRRL Y-27907]|uniref:Pyridoxamine 5'-phosphate oxidase N-terminal domain-containing protein n=1 Tax=Spathaspora passalidarum (strain NRRL Y-27907 / 11-Y1) TaxID=619300 RepID=G3APG8_SPAPN|nr:uncharacterized protein SPAPADRAFT_61222 [Spathaspora passalidarum NRRL Y-27907]EGW32139.1 hypothetical protein SPAPADRAFT_61222 [Spathaspora passalidarum NRRL Y-27907]
METPDKLPDSVLSLLKSSRFIHLATCLNDKPHVSLMNYTFCQQGDKQIIIISTPTRTTKYQNMLSNPNVSILIHDWISVKDTTESKESVAQRRNSLFELLASFNKNEISRVSVMLDGKAKILDKNKDSETFNFYKSLHLNNPKIDENQVRNYIENENNALVLIEITGCKVTDTDNNIEEY